MKKRWLLLLSVLSALLFAACGQGGGSGKDAKPEAKKSEVQKAKVGVVSDTNRVIWADVKKRLKDEENIDLEIVTMDDWVTPNVAVQEGELDMNCFEYIPFLHDYNDAHDADLVPVGYAYLPPISIYAVDSIKSIDDVPEGASFALPEDPVNLGHSLLEIEKAGLITLKATEVDNPTLDDIETNPKNIEFKLLEGSNIARALGDVDLMITGSSVAADAGYDKEDAVYTEDPEKTSNYYKVMLVVKRDRVDDPLIQKIKEAYQSEETKKTMQENFDDNILPAWPEDDKATADYDEYVKKLEDAGK